MNDKDFEQLLNEYREKSPSDLQVQKWKRAVRSVAGMPTVSRRSTWISVAVASIFGFVLGALFVRSTTETVSTTQFASFDEENATIEYVVTKTY